MNYLSGALTITKSLMFYGLLMVGQGCSTTSGDKVATKIYKPSIKPEIQQIIESEVKQLVDETKAEYAFAVIADPKTGKIMALSKVINDKETGLAVIPYSEIKDFTYLPGGTLKPVTAAMAIDEGIVDLDTMINCEDGHWKEARLRDAQRIQGEVTVAQALRKQSNIGCSKIAMKLGSQKLIGGLQSFGFMQPVVVDSMDKTITTFKQVNPENLDARATAFLILGQNLYVSPFQTLQSYCAFANNGLMPKLSINANSSVSLQPLLKPETADQISNVLEKIGQDRKFELETAVQQGTAHKIIDNKLAREKYQASAVGYFPTANPQAVLLMIIDAPQKAKSKTGYHEIRASFNNIRIQVSAAINQ